MEIRQAEPYSYCQFIMGRDRSAHGRAHHPFMTSSADWAYNAANRYMLGIRPGFDRLTVDPCIPAAWEGFEAERHWRGRLSDSCGKSQPCGKGRPSAGSGRTDSRSNPRVFLWSAQRPGGHGGNGGANI